MKSEPIAPRDSRGAWSNRPIGLPSGVPPPSVPLSFLGAAAMGLIAFGIALMTERGVSVVDPTDDRVVGVAHLAMLATLSMGVLGALHQFTPVITRRPLRSVRLSRATFLSWLAGSWLLPIGFMTQRERVVEIGGGCAALAVVLLVANISAPLGERVKGATVTGLRLAVTGFVATACFGVIYVIDRRENWFDLSGHVVLAHACIGLLAWLGLAYVSVSEKLWPMFMLAHRSGRHRSAWIAVWSLFAGVFLLSPGFLFSETWLALSGALLVVIGLSAHVFSLIAHVRSRRRSSDLHLWFVISAALWLVTSIPFAAASALTMPHDHHLGVAMAAATLVALAGWLLVALVGHSYKVVPFVAWSSLRGRNITVNIDGLPLKFGDLFNHRWSFIDFVLVNLGVLATSLGFATSASILIGVGGAAFAAAGIVIVINLSRRSLRLLRVRDEPASIEGT